MTGRRDERIPLRAIIVGYGVDEVRKACVELALDAIVRQFGEHGRMSDCIKSMGCPERQL